MNSSKSFNKINCILNIHNIKKINGILDFQFDFFETASNKLTLDYDLESENKKLSLNYHPDLQNIELIKVDMKLNKSDTSITIQFPHEKKYFSLSGKNNVQDNEVHILYNIHYLNHLLKIDYLYINKNYTQAKFEMNSNIKGWENLILENRIDDNKIRIFIYCRYHKLSLIADKTAINDQEKDLFTITYNDEPLVNIRSGNDQIFLMTSSMYINYKLGVQYVPDPRIYAFSILKNGENLMSFVLQNKSNFESMKLRGKLIAPILFTNYQDITFNLNSNYQISKSLQFTITTANKSLFDIKWFSKLENSLYEAYFKYSSEIPLLKLKLLEVHPSVNMWNDFTFKINFVQENAMRYFTELVIPFKQLDTKFVLEFPCKTYQCDYNFYANKTFVDIHWNLPIENLNKVKLKVDFNNINTLNNSIGDIVMESNDNSIVYGWNIAFNNKSFLIYMKSKINKTIHNREISYKYVPYKQIILNVELDKLTTTLRFDNNTIQSGRFLMESNGYKILYSGFLSNKHLNLTISNNLGTKHIFLSKESTKTATCVDFYMSTDFTATEVTSNLNPIIEEGTVASLIMSMTSLITSPLLPNNIKSKILLDKQDEVKFDFNTTLLNTEEAIYTLTFRHNNSNSKLLVLGPDLNYNIYYNRNKNVFSVESHKEKIVHFKYLLETNVTEIQSLVDIEYINFDFSLQYLKEKNAKNLQIKLPSFFRQYILYDLTISNIDDEYLLENKITLSQNKSISVRCKASFLDTFANLQIYATSPYTDDFMSNVMYDVNKNDINLAISTSLGQKNITATCIIIPKQEISVILRTPFVGYTSMSLEAQFDNANNKVYFKLFKEGNSLILDGTMTNTINDIYELSMSAKIENANESFAFIYIKLDRRVMKFNANFNWNSKSVLLGIDTKTLNLSGVYLKSNNTYKLEGNGQWDSTIIIFFGNISLEPNDFNLKSEVIIGENHQGKIDISINRNDTSKHFKLSGYFPKPSSNIYITLQSHKGNVDREELHIKTPFNNFKNVSISLIRSNKTLEAKTEMNIAKTTISAEVTAVRRNSGVDVHSHIVLPTTKYSTEVSLDVMSSLIKTENFFFHYDFRNNFTIKLISSISQNVVFEVVHKKSKGEIYYSYKNSEMIISYMIMDYFNLNAKHPVADFNLNLSRNNFKLDVHNSNTIFYEIIYLNNPEKLKLSFMRTNYDLIYKIELNKDLTRLALDLQKLLNFVYEKKNAHFNLLLNADDYIRAELNTTKTLIHFRVNSSKLDAISISGNLERAKLFGRTVFKFEKRDENLIHFNEFHNNKQVNISFDFKNNLNLVLKHEYNNSKIFIDIRNLDHEISYEFSELGAIKLLFKSPTILNNGFVMRGNAISPLNLHFSINSADNNIIYIKLITNIDNNSFYIDFQSPQNDVLSYIHFETIWGNSIFKTMNNIEVISSKLGNVSAIGNFDLTKDGLDVVTHLRLPFLDNFEFFDAEVHIHKNLTPWFSVRLPNNKTYSAKIVYFNNDSIFSLDLGYICAERKYGLNITYSKDNSFVSGEILSPYEGYQHFLILVKKEINIIHGVFNINERIYHANISHIFEDDRQWFLAKLSTSFVGYENYYFEIDHGNHFFNCFLFYPNLKRPIGFGFDTRNKLGIHYKLSLLYPILDFEYALCEINVVPDDTMLIIKAVSHLNDNFIKADLQVNKVRALRYIDVILETKDNTIAFKSNMSYENYLRYNKNYLYNIIFNESLDLYIDLFLREISGQFDISSKYFKINVSNPKIASDHYGGHFLYDQLSNNCSIGLYLPHKVITIDQKYHSNLTDNFYMARISWNGKPIGFTSHLSKTKEPKLINIHFKLDVELPVREFQLDHNFKLYMNNLEPITTEIATNIKWDKQDNGTIAWHAVLSNRYVQSIISSGILDHDVILYIEFSKLSEMPFRLMLDLEYSPLVEKRVHIEMFYNKTFMNDVMIDERKFIVRQPFSRLNHTTIWRTSKGDKYTNITVLLRYTDFVANSPDFIKASLEIGNEEFEISGLVENKKNSLSIHSKSETNLYSKGLNINLKINDNEPLTLDYLYTFKEPTPSFKLVTGYGNYRNYDFFMGIPTKKEITVKLVHNIYGKEFTDGLITLKLNTTSLLWVKMLWKTNLLNQFHKTIIDEYSDMKFVVESIGRQLIDVISDQTGKELLQEFQGVRKNVSFYIDQETKKITNDLGLVWSDIQIACTNNTLYCKDIINLKSQWSNVMYNNLTEPFVDVIYNFCHNLITISRKTFGNIMFAFDEIEKIMREIDDIQKLKENAKLALNNALQEAKKSIKTMKETATKLLQDFESYTFAVKMDIDGLLKPAFNLIDDFWAYFEHQLTYVQIIVLETMEVIQTYALNLRETKELLQMYNGITLSVSSINLLDIINSVWNVIEVIASNVITNIKDVFDDYAPYVDSLQLTIFGGYKELLQPYFDDVKGLLNIGYEKIVWFWRHHQVTGNIKNYVMTRWSSFINVMVINLIGNTDEGLGIFDYIYKPEVGVVEISQRLPVEWESFDKSPAFEQHPLYNHIFQKISSLAINRLEIFITKLKIFTYALFNIKITPPTENFAMIIGNDHFVTFNNKHFDFKGDCSYVLLSDFDKKTFSVILNYDQQSKRRKSLTVISYNNSAIVPLFEDRTVVLNSEGVDLPISIQNLYITKEDENTIINNNKGLLIICNSHYNICTFEVSEWLFGKVGGLLGTLDNEPNTDMTTPDGLQVETVEELVNSWKLARCDMNTTEISIAKPVIPAMVHTLINSTCAEIFLERNSTISQCFPIVDAEPFYAMCIKDIRMNFEANVCSSVAAYRSQCSYRHVAVQMPAFCVSCSLDETIDSEEKIFDVHNPKTLDIVFIQELGCFDNILGSLPNKLKDVLVTTEFINNRFAFVVYGGNYLAKPAVNTINGTVWTNKLPNLSTLKISHQQGKSQYTAEDAIKFAAKLQFRPAVRKLFVLIQCQICEDLAHSPELFNILGENDINLHIIKPNPFGQQHILAIDSTNKLIDNEGILQNATSNEKIMDNLQDMCCGLALSTSGTVATGSLFDNNIDKWTALVVSTTKQCSCQKCKCIQKANGVGKIECMRCMSPLVKQLLNEYESQHIRT